VQWNKTYLPSVCASRDLRGDHQRNNDSSRRVFIARTQLTPGDAGLPRSHCVTDSFQCRRATACRTTKKAQSQTLNYIGLYLPRPAVFSQGQLALFRASSEDRITVYIDTEHPLDGVNGAVTKETSFFPM